MNKRLLCTSCKGIELRDLGSIYKLNGLFKLDDPGHLYHCTICNLFFRYPYFDELALSDAYNSIDAKTWVYGDREDTRLARNMIISTCSAGAVLDVGCFRGDFLRSLPELYTCHGIELSLEARKFAQSKGIDIVADSIQNFDAEHMQFDVITLLDVIEHLPFPTQALEKLSKALKPGGVMLISTGNTDALPWRMMRLHYWYYFPEHVSFFNKKYFQWIGKDLGLKLTKVQCFSHFEASLFVRLRQVVEAIIFSVVQYGRNKGMLNHLLALVYPFSRAMKWTSPPKTTAWPDHILVTLRKKH